MVRQVSENIICRLLKIEEYTGVSEYGHCHKCHNDKVRYAIEMCKVNLGKNRQAEVCCDVYQKLKEYISKNVN